MPPPVVANVAALACSETPGEFTRWTDWTMAKCVGALAETVEEIVRLPFSARPPGGAGNR